MLGVKITVVLIVVTLIVRYLVQSYIASSPLEALAIATNKYTPWYTVVLGILVAASGLGIVYSVVYLLFFWKR